MSGAQQAPGKEACKGRGATGRWGPHTADHGPCNDTRPFAGRGSTIGAAACMNGPDRVGPAARQPGFPGPLRLWEQVAAVESTASLGAGIAASSCGGGPSPVTAYPIRGVTWAGTLRGAATPAGALFLQQPSCRDAKTSGRQSLCSSDGFLRSPAPTSICPCPPAGTARCTPWSAWPSSWSAPSCPCMASRPPAAPTRFTGRASSWHPAVARCALHRSASCPPAQRRVFGAWALTVLLPHMVRADMNICFPVARLWLIGQVQHSNHACIASFHGPRMCQLPLSKHRSVNASVDACQ